MTSTAQNTGEKTVSPTASLTVSREECQALVDRIAASVELRRAARLRSFLVHVCEQTLQHGASVIHEQEIGSAVFGRPPSYDTSIDNIVRVNATELRKRLEHYFAEEGREEDLILEIQRGSYTPTFRRRIQTDPTPPIARPEPIPALPPQSAPQLSKPLEEAPPERPAATAASNSLRPTGRTALRLWKLAAIVLLAACLGLAWQVHELDLKSAPAWSREPALRAFWSEFFRSGNDADVILADTSLAIAEDILQRHIALPDYLDYNYKRFAEAATLPEAQRTDLALVLERNNGSIADFRVAQQILALDAPSRRFKLSFAREYTPEAAKHDSLVLIGSRQSNPWVSLFADRLNFDLDYDAPSRHAVVVNHAPQPGESPTYPAPESGYAPGTGYAVIAFIPDLSGKGRTLIVEGSDSQATGAAGDFVTSEDSMAMLEQKFPAGEVPCFEVLLRTAQLSGTPLRHEVVAYRIYAPNGTVIKK